MIITQLLMMHEMNDIMFLKGMFGWDKYLTAREELKHLYMELGKKFE